MLNYIVLIFILMCSCEGIHERSKKTHQWMEKNGKLKVLSTTAMINDLVQNIAKEHADVITLIQGNLDPHSYQLVKGDDEKLAKADLIFQNGLGLEHGASLERYLRDSKKVIPLGNLIQSHFPEKIYFVGNQVDPHIWMDISLFANSIPFIQKALSEKDPEHAAEYKKNGDALLASLLQIHERIYSEIHQIPEEKRFIVTSHDAFNYFTRAYLSEETELLDAAWQKRFAAPEGLAPDSQLSSTDIQAILDHLIRYHIQVIFPESNVSQDSIRKVVDAARQLRHIVLVASDPLYGDAMGSEGSNGDTYPKMLEHDAEVIKKYLNK